MSQVEVSGHNDRQSHPEGTRRMANCQSVSFNSEGYRIAGNLFLTDAQRSVPLVVVCHGAGGWKEDFKQLCEVLAGAGYAALAIDMRGHGQSEGPPWYLDMCQWS